MDIPSGYISRAAAAFVRLIRSPITAVRRTDLSRYDNLFISLNGERVNIEGGSLVAPNNDGSDVFNIRFYRNETILENSFDLGQIAEAFGVEKEKICFFNFDYFNQDGSQGIVGKLNLTCPNNGSPLALTVNGVSLSGVVCSDDRDSGSFPFTNSPTTLLLNSDGGAIFANSGSAQIDNSSIRIFGLDSIPASPNSIVNCLGVLPAIQDYTVDVLYKRQFTIDQSQNFDTNAQLFSNLDGTFSTFAIDNSGDAPRLVQRFFTATGAPMPELQRDIITYVNSGPNPTGVAEQDIPMNNTDFAGFAITNFAARQLSNGAIGIAATYNRGIVETGGISMVIDQMGNMTAGARDVSFPATSTAFNFLQRKIALVGAEANAVDPDSHNFFAAFSRRGNSPAEGIFYNATAGLIEQSLVADHQVLLPVENNQIAIDGYSSASSAGGRVTIGQFSNTTALEEIAGCEVHVIENGEEYVVANEASDDLPIIIIPPSVVGAVITFVANAAANITYTLVNQGGGASYCFSGIDTQNPIIDAVNIDGAPSSVVHFGGANIIFVGQGVDIVTDLVAQLNDCSSIASSTQNPSTSKGGVSADPSIETSQSTSTQRPDTTESATRELTALPTIVALPNTTLAPAATTIAGPSPNPSSSVNPYVIGGVIGGVLAIMGGAWLYNKFRSRTNAVAPEPQPDQQAVELSPVQDRLQPPRSRTNAFAPEPQPDQQDAAALPPPQAVLQQPRNELPPLRVPAANKLVASNERNHESRV